MNWSERERRWWIAALVLILLIYASLYFVRGPAEFLRARGLLRLTVAALFGVAALGVVWKVWKRGAGLREGLVLLAFAGVFCGAVLLPDLPEEKLHFLEYGLLGSVLFQACQERSARLGRGRLSATWLAMVLAGLAGWGDEGIQALLPNRYYDLRDILWNLLGSSIVILALFAGAAARKRDLSRRRRSFPS